MTSPPIRVFLVEDSAVCLAILQRMLSASPEIEVVGTARNGKVALELIPQVDPHVICTDLQMPIMNGLDFTKAVMAKYPRAILVVSDYVQEEHTRNIFALLEAGAIDILPKPRGGSETEYQAQAQELITKIKILSGVMVFRRREPVPHSMEKSKPVHPAFPSKTKFRMVVIGASTGGPRALQTILTQLPANFPTPVLCVQHVSTGFLEGLTSWLSIHSPMKIEIARPCETPRAGAVYFPQEGTHLELDSEGNLASSTSPAIDGHRPSVDITFKSVAWQYGKSAIGVLLTGMGRDGAAGMCAIAQGGGLTIAQDEQSCVVFGMPKHAIELGAASHILPLRDIASTLISTVST